MKQKTIAVLWHTALNEEMHCLASQTLPSSAFFNFITDVILSGGDESRLFTITSKSNRLSLPSRLLELGWAQFSSTHFFIISYALHSVHFNIFILMYFVTYNTSLIFKLIDNLKMFIGHEYCYNIYRSQNNLIIMFELSKEDIDNGVDQELRNKLNELLQEIKNKPKPKVDFLTGKIYR